MIKWGVVLKHCRRSTASSSLLLLLLLVLRSQRRLGPQCEMVIGRNAMLPHLDTAWNPLLYGIEHKVVTFHPGEENVPAKAPRRQPQGDGQRGGQAV